MHRKFALVAAFVCLGIAAVPQSQPSSSPQPSPQPEPAQPSSGPQDGVTGGYVGVSPQQVRKSGLGEIGVSFLLKKDGSVDELRPLYDDPRTRQFVTAEHPELERMVLENIKQWKYSPFLLEGRPVEVRTGVALPFDFKNPAETLQGSLASSSAQNIQGTKLPMSLLWWCQIDEKEIIFMRVKDVQPQYPLMAKVAHLQGAAVLRFQIDKQGNVADLKGVQGEPILVQAATDAVRKWKYRPITVNGQPLEVLTQVVVKFHM